MEILKIGAAITSGAFAERSLLPRRVKLLYETLCVSDRSPELD
ncbi:hypothetical protein [Nostoc sp.]